MAGYALLVGPDGSGKTTIAELVAAELRSMGKGFVFMNPNAKKSCGCGSSFST